jgi:hypothetical protein
MRAREGRRLLVPCLTMALASGVLAMRQDEAGRSARSIEQFLAQDGAQPSYRATRRLEAENGSRSAWLEAGTDYAPAVGFTYAITAEGGSGYIRNKVLRAVLKAEQEVIARGEATRASIEPANYRFVANGIDADGLANVLISPRRRERALVSGTMFLTPAGGELVRLQGRLARNPSFWVKNVDIVRRYARIGGVSLPVSLESKAELRMLGDATLRMTYTYLEVDGQPVQSTPAN